MEIDKNGQPAYFKSSIDAEYPGEIPPFLNDEELRYVLVNSFYSDFYTLAAVS